MGKAALAFLMLLLATASAEAQLAVTDRAISRKTGRLHLDIRYPQTGIAAIDKLLDGRARAHMDSGMLAAATAERPYSITVTYEVKRNDARMFSVLVKSYRFTGGAHGIPGVESFNFLMPGAHQIFLPELVDGQSGLDLISELAIAALTRQLAQSGMADQDWIRSGAAPQAANFAAFVWQPDVLELIFPPYQVAPYAAGDQTVRIPLSELAGVIRPDPQAPAPSFSCAAARTAVEKTICSDAALARLDRQVAERYQEKLGGIQVPALKSDETALQRQNRETEQRRRDALIAGQRAFLAQRDTACAAGGKTCLTAHYQARLKAL